MSIKGNALDVSNFDKDFLREKVDLTPVDEAVAKSIVQSVSFAINLGPNNNDVIRNSMVSTSQTNNFKRVEIFIIIKLYAALRSVNDA